MQFIVVAINYVCARNDENGNKIDDQIFLHGKLFFWFYRCIEHRVSIEVRKRMYDRKPFFLHRYMVRYRTFLCLQRNVFFFS